MENTTFLVNWSDLIYDQHNEEMLIDVSGRLQILRLNDQQNVKSQDILDHEYWCFVTHLRLSINSKINPSTAKLDTQIKVM